MGDTQKQWLTANPARQLRRGELHIWCMQLTGSEAEFHELHDLLTSEEADRASKFVFDRDHKRFVFARGRLRQLLGHYLNLHPREIQFIYSAEGKPEIAPGTGEMFFNLSHSGEVALCAFSLDKRIGIDVENIRHDMAVVEIAERFFCANELIKLREEEGGDPYHQLFFQYWTRKEALLKATGKGILFPLEELDVSTQNGKAWTMVSLPGTTESRWWCRDIFPGEGLAAAVVVEGESCELMLLKYPVLK